VGIPAECMVFLLMGGAYLRSRIKQAGKWDQETIVSFFLCQYCSGEYLPPIRWLRQSPRARANVGRAAADGTLAYAIHGFGLGDPSELRGREHAEPQRNQPAEQGVSPVRRGRRQVADDGVCQIGSALIYSVFLCNQPGFGRVGFYLRKHWTNFHRVAGPISSSPCDKE
ncbi:hypothetical protein, partial [Aeromonas sp. Prich7-2]|uniref:hypothetical protein n=1 Tax=Aeromonas sp. Prich7-2 TaxID=2823361 RepID=UPI001B324ABE